MRLLSRAFERANSQGSAKGQANRQKCHGCHTSAASIGRTLVAQKLQDMLKPRIPAPGSTLLFAFMRVICTRQERERERERGRERERARAGERERAREGRKEGRKEERQTDRQKERERETETETETATETETERDRERDRERERERASEGEGERERDRDRERESEQHRQDLSQTENDICPALYNLAIILENCRSMKPGWVLDWTLVDS